MDATRRPPRGVAEILYQHKKRMVIDYHPFAEPVSAKEKLTK
jgi:hypothetical protein